MTNEKLYTLAIEAIKELCGDAETADDIINNPRSWEGSNDYRNTAHLLLALQEKLDCTGGKASTVAAIKRIIKMSAGNGSREPRGWIDESNRFCACSGYHAVRLVYDVPSMPHGEPFLNLDKAVKLPSSLAPLDLPPIKEIRAHIAANRGKKQAAPLILSINGFEWGCNAQLLLDILQALPDCTAYAPEGPLHAMYFTAPDGSDGTLLPVRLRNRPAQTAD